MWKIFSMNFEREWATTFLSKDFSAGFKNSCIFTSALLHSWTSDKSARWGDQNFFSVAQGQVLLAWGDRAPLEHSLVHLYGIY